MPFDPDAFLAEKQTDIPVGSSAKQFDPDAFLVSSGVDIKAPELPRQASSLEAVGNSATQGPTMGFGDELSAAVGALASTPIDKELNRSYTNRYSNIRDKLRQDLEKSRSDHPVISAVSEIASSIPTAIATGGLGGLGLVGSAAAQGGLYGLGSSKKETIEQTIKDTALSSLLSAGIAKVGKTIASSLSKDSSPIAELAGKSGNFEIKYGPGLKESFKLGQEMESALSNPETQQTISRELNAQQGNIAKAIQSAKQNIGQRWMPLIEEHGNTPVNLQDTFSTIYNKISKIAPEGDEVAGKVQEALATRIKGIEDQLISHTGTLKDVPLKAVAEAQEALGNIIFEQGAYRKIPAVNGAAKHFFGKLASAFETADLEAGSGGDLTNINKMYSALYKMQENKLTGAAISKLASDPQSTVALKAYDSFIKPFADIDPGIRSSLAPELDNYISNNFQKALLKSQLMKKVTGKGPSTTNEGAIGWALKKAYLTPATLDNIANHAGVLSNKMRNIPGVSKVAGALKSVGPVAPAIGALTVVE